MRSRRSLKRGACPWPGSAAASSTAWPRRRPEEERRRPGRHVLPVNIMLRQKRQPLADGAFLLGMDIPFHSRIRDDRHRGAAHIVRRPLLGRPDLRPAGPGTRQPAAERRQLDKQEGQFLLPQGPPAADQLRENPVIQLCLRVVRLPLVPQDTPDRVRRDLR